MKAVVVELKGKPDGKVINEAVGKLTASPGLVDFSKTDKIFTNYECFK